MGKVVQPLLLSGLGRWVDEASRFDGLGKSQTGLQEPSAAD